MEIKDLKEDYPLVYQAAMRHKKAYLGDDYLESAFIFRDTAEGYDFWSEVAIGEFEKAKGLCPHLFEEEEVIDPIAEIKEGRMAIEKDDVEVTRKCLDYCFPEDDYSREDNDRIINDEDNKYFEAGGGKYWAAVRSTHLPVIQATDLWEIIPKDETDEKGLTALERMDILGLVIKMANGHGLDPEEHIANARKIEEYIING